MAIKKIQLKRYDGSEWDVFHPETDKDQVVGLQSALDNKISDSEKGSSDGVATLDGSSRIPLDQIPESVMSGLKMVDVITDQDDFDSFVSDTEGVEENIGHYVIVGSSVDGDLDLSHGDILFKDPQGSGYTDDVTVQSGDWILYSGYEYTDSDGDFGDADTNYWVYAIIDNNQGDRYLTKNGGSLSGDLSLGGNDITNVDTIKTNGYEFRENSSYLFIDSDNSDRLTFYVDGEKYVIPHKGVSGPESEVDADTIDGHNSSEFLFRDGSSSMSGNLDLGNHRLEFTDGSLETSGGDLKYSGDKIWSESNSKFKDVIVTDEEPTGTPTTDTIWFDTSS